MVMNDQIEEMQELGISAIALSMDSELLESRKVNSLQKCTIPSENCFTT